MAMVTVPYSVEVDVRADMPPLPRVGLQMVLEPREICRGLLVWPWPWENYPDRCAGALVDRYRLPLSAMQSTYVVPQENGARCDVREMTLINKEQNLTVTGDEPLIITVSPLLHRTAGRGTARQRASRHRDRPGSGWMASIWGWVAMTPGASRSIHSTC